MAHARPSHHLVYDPWVFSDPSSYLKRGVRVASRFPARDRALDGLRTEITQTLRNLRLLDQQLSAMARDLGVTGTSQSGPLPRDIPTARTTSPLPTSPLKSLTTPVYGQPIVDLSFITAYQAEIQSTSRKFATISNALKAAHDSAMKSIRNMKA